MFESVIDISTYLSVITFKGGAARARQNCDSETGRNQYAPLWLSTAPTVRKQARCLHNRPVLHVSHIKSLAFLGGQIRAAGHLPRTGDAGLDQHAGGVQTVCNGHIPQAAAGAAPLRTYRPSIR